MSCAATAMPSGGRRLCGVLYLHDHWEPAYGGRLFLFREGGSHFAIEPVPNRQVLFNVTVRNDRAIEEMGAVPEGW